VAIPVRSVPRRSLSKHTHIVDVYFAWLSAATEENGRRKSVDVWRTRMNAAADGFGHLALHIRGLYVTLLG